MSKESSVHDTEATQFHQTSAHALKFDLIVQYGRLGDLERSAQEQKVLNPNPSHAEHSMTMSSLALTVPTSPRLRRSVDAQLLR